MGNMMDYINWRGDLSFLQSPFCEVDNLIFSQMSYLNFDGIVGPIGDAEGITIQEAARQYVCLNDLDELIPGSLEHRTYILFEAMSHSDRYRYLTLYDYQNVRDEQEAKQFAAIRIDFGNGIHFIAFRGTDNTLVGWKEDFSMSFLNPIPAQRDAFQYLNQVTEIVKTRKWSKKPEFILGGHSKGGNLAVYAAIKAEDSVQRKIIKIYNNDGPGFDTSMIQSLGYQSMLPKIQTIVPETSIVGMLLQHEEDYTVVKSNQIGRMQHDATSWEIQQKSFVRLKEVSRESVLIDRTIKTWLNSMEEVQKRVFVDALFSILTSSDAKTLNELQKEPIKSVTSMIKAMRHLDADSKKNLTRTVNALVKANFFVKVDEEIKKE